MTLTVFAGRADTFPITGKSYTDLYVPTRNSNPPKPLQQLSTSLWLESDPRLSEKFTSKIVYQGDGFDAQYSSFSGNTTVTNLHSQLREGYITYNNGSGLELRGGQQIISWGKTDVLNPTDYNSAKNLNFFNPDDEVKRVSSTSVQANLVPGGDSKMTLTAVWNIIPAEGRLLIPSTTVPANATVSDPQFTPVTFSNSEFAEKISYNGSGWDMSVSTFSGFGHMPELKLNSVTFNGTTPTINMDQIYRRIAAFGADGSYSTSKWIFRGESAFTQTANNDGSNPLILPSHWDSVVGAEYALSEYFRIQGQAILRVFPQYTSPTQATGSDANTTQLNQLIATTNALLQQYQDPSRPSGTLRVGYLNEKSGIDTDLFIVQNFNGGDYLFRPRFSYSWNDFMKSTVGAELYGGPTNRPLGVLSPYSSVFSEFKYTF